MKHRKLDGITDLTTSNPMEKGLEKIDLDNFPPPTLCLTSTVGAEILALCAPMPNRNTETELWRRNKEWLYFFVRQRGNIVG